MWKKCRIFHLLQMQHTCFRNIFPGNVYLGQGCLCNMQKTKGIWTQSKSILGGGGRKRFTIWVYLMSTPFSFSSTKMYDPKFRSDCLNIWIVKSYRDNLGNMHHQVESFTLNKKIDKTYVGRYENNHTGKAVFQERFLKFSW